MADDPVQPGIGDEELRDALDRLSRLVIGDDQQDMLRQVAEFAMGAVAGADGVGLTLLESRQPNLVVSDQAFVQELDLLQYELGTGPSIEAVRTRRTVVCDSLATETRWQPFGSRAGQLGVSSALALPLLAGELVLGVLNVYSYQAKAFDERSIRLGELFAIPVAIQVRNAQSLFQTRQLVTNLQAALVSRAVIDQAAGILMSRLGCTAEEAIARLKMMSQTSNRRLAVVAGQLVDEAVNRARARRPVQDTP